MNTYTRVSKSGITTWRCNKYITNGCRARVSTHGSDIISDKQPIHTHDSSQNDKDSDEDEMPPVHVGYGNHDKRKANELHRPVKRTKIDTDSDDSSVHGNHSNHKADEQQRMTKRAKIDTNQDSKAKEFLKQHNYNYLTEESESYDDDDDESDSDTSYDDNVSCSSVYDSFDEKEEDDEDEEEEDDDDE